MTEKKELANGPVIVKNVADMTRKEKHEIDNLIRRAYIRHGFYLAQEYLNSFRDKDAEPNKKFDVPNILHRLSQAGKPLHKIVML